MRTILASLVAILFAGLGLSAQQVQSQGSQLAVAQEGLILNVHRAMTAPPPNIRPCGDLFFVIGPSPEGPVLAFFAIHGGGKDAAFHLVGTSRLEVHVWSGPQVAKVRPKELPERLDVPALRIDVPVAVFDASPCLAEAIIKRHV